MKNFIQAMSLLFVLCTTYAHVTAQRISTIPKIEKKNFNLGFTPVSTSIRSATLINVRELPKSLVPVPDKQYTVDLCSNGPEVIYEAYSITGVAYGSINFKDGYNYLLFRIKAPAPAYYIVEMNIISYSKPFTIKTGGTSSTVNSPDNKKLTFFVQLKQGNNEIEIESNTEWSFYNAQITLLKK